MEPFSVCTLLTEAREARRFCSNCAAVSLGAATFVIPFVEMERGIVPFFFGLPVFQVPTKVFVPVEPDRVPLGLKMSMEALPCSGSRGYRVPATRIPASSQFLPLSSVSLGSDCAPAPCGPSGDTAAF